MIGAKFLAKCLIMMTMFVPLLVQARTIQLVLNNPTAPPFTTAKHNGLFDVEVGEAFRRVGLQLKLVKLPAERGLINANLGIDDGDLSRIAGIGKIYHNLIRVPEKLFDMQFVAFTRFKLIKHASWSSLKPYSVCYIKGWKIFEENLPPGTEVTTADTPDQLMDMLELGREQFVLYSRWMGLALAKSMGLKDVHIVEPALAERSMYVYLNKKYAAYILPLAHAIRVIQHQGKYRRLCVKELSQFARPTDQCRFQ